MKDENCEGLRNASPGNADSQVQRPGGGESATHSEERKQVPFCLQPGEQEGDWEARGRDGGSYRALGTEVRTWGLILSMMGSRCGV